MLLRLLYFCMQLCYSTSVLQLVSVWGGVVSWKEQKDLSASESE